MDFDVFTVRLGRRRALDPIPPDPTQRVLAYDGETVVGVAAYEPLFGHQAEGAIATAPDSTDALVSFLLDGLAEAAGSAGITLVRFGFDGPQQRRLASELTAGRTGCALRSDRFELRTCQSTRTSERRARAL